MSKPPSLFGLEMSDSFILAVLSLMGTAAAFVFEIGYCTFHGIPWSLIVFSTPRIVAFSITFLVLFLYFALYMQSALALSKGKTGFERGVGKFLMFLALIAVGIFASGARVEGYHILVALVAVQMVLFFGLQVGDVGPQENVNLKSTVTDLTNHPRRLSLYTLAAISLCFVFGARQASTLDRQYVDKERPDQALVAVYGENWIFRKADPAAGIFLDEIQVIQRDRVGDIRLVRPSIPLFAPDRLGGDVPGTLTFPIDDPDKSGGTTDVPGGSQPDQSDVGKAPEPDQSDAVARPDAGKSDVN